MNIYTYLYSVGSPTPNGVLSVGASPMDPISLRSCTPRRGQLKHEQERVCKQDYGVYRESFDIDLQEWTGPIPVLEIPRPVSWQFIRDVPATR